MARKLKVAIAGGGIGGSAAAVALLRKGFDVDVYEQSSQLAEVGAGIQISPNGTRTLDYLGVFDRLKKVSCAPEKKEFRLWNTGDRWPMFDLGGQAIEKYGYPYLTVYRPDLLGALVEAATALKPDVFHLQARAVAVEQDDASATLILQDGQRIHCDVLIGADGVRSVISRELWQADAPRYAGMIAWRSVIPMNSLPSHMQQMVGTTWIGPGAHLVNYPLRDGTLMNLVGTVECDSWNDESWFVEGTTGECLRNYRGWHEDVQTVIRAAPRLHKWAFAERPTMQKWTAGRTTLLGDACHPTLPFLAQGAVMAMEDAVVLARCLEKYVDDPAAALLKYESLRVERTSATVRGARANTDRFHSAELVSRDRAEAYLAKEMGADPIRERYDWLYTYDAAAQPI